MPWDMGTFERTNGTYDGAAVWTTDAANAIKIRADRHDTHDEDLAQGINACLNKNGQNSPTANISWGGFKITNLAAASNNGDAVRWEQIVPVTGGNFTGETGDARGNFRDAPANVQNTAYTFVMLDRGRSVLKTNTTAYTWTIPPESSVAFPDGSIITVVNDGASGNITVTPGSGVTLLNGPTSGAVTVGGDSVRTLLKVGTNRWRII